MIIAMTRRTRAGNVAVRCCTFFMPRVGRAMVTAVLLVTTCAAAAMADVTVSPSSGPPGTQVTVSGITTCEGAQPPTLSFATVDGLGVGAPSVPFAPPSGTLTVPNVPDGDYHIVSSCGAGEGYVVFAVRATPIFTG
jgi:hypothetical protein